MRSHTRKRSLPFGRIHVLSFTSALAALLAILAAPCAEAELTWVKKTVEVSGDARLPVLEAHFHFTNTGTNPVEIRNVESSCGCTTAALDKRVYKPAETGEIVAKYTVGTHVGTQEKTLLVLTNDGRPPTTLTLVAHIPEILRINPPMVTWMHDEAPDAKQISLELMQDAPFDDISVESSSPRATAKLVPVTKGRTYELVVVPESTDRFLYAKLTIHCRFGSENKTFLAYATVRPGAGAQ
jgi:hypothetical protein